MMADMRKILTGTYGTSAFLVTHGGYGKKKTGMKVNIPVFFNLTMINSLKINE